MSCCDTSLGLDISARNAADPDAPEYGKGYKPENNAGCCGGCGSNCSDNQTTTSSKTVIRARNVREDFVS